jgi:acyl transferase domain-containing protein
MKPPVVPLVANVTAGAVKDPAAIRESLVRQVTATVRWRECVAFMANDGVSFFAELGSGKVLSGLARRIAPDATAVAAGTPDEIAALASQHSRAAPHPGPPPQGEREQTCAPSLPSPSWGGVGGGGRRLAVTHPNSILL